MLEGERVVLGVLKSSLEIHPVQVRLGHIDGVPAHMLQV